MNPLRQPTTLTAVQMNDASGCSRCHREIPLLAFAFLDERYAAVCNECAAAFYNADQMLKDDALNDAVDRGGI